MEWKASGRNGPKNGPGRPELLLRLWAFRFRRGRRVMFDVESRALQSGGATDRAIYQMVARAIRARHSGGGVLIDVGCGEGALWAFLRDRFRSYIGVDVIRFN